MLFWKTEIFYFQIKIILLAFFTSLLSIIYNIISTICNYFSFINTNFFGIKISKNVIFFALYTRKIVFIIY